MIDKSITIDDGQTIYCPECDANYEMSYSEGKGTVYVTCECGEAERIQMFLKRFMNSKDASTLDGTEDRTYQ